MSLNQNTTKPTNTDFFGRGIQKSNAIEAKIERGKLQRYIVPGLFISPQDAEVMLSMNLEGNRRLDARRVAEFAAMIENGKFCHTHQGIAFDTNGRLQDGQHRLAAIVKSGIGVQMDATFGVHPDFYKTVDVGTPKSANVILGTAGFANGHIIAGAVRIMAAVKDGIRLSSVKMSLSDIVEFANDNPDIVRSATLAHNIRYGFKIPLSATTATLFSIRGVGFSWSTVEAFAEAIRDGIGVTTQNDAVAVYRRRTAQAGYGKGIEAMAIQVKVFNGWYTHTPIRVLAFKDNETFPAIVKPR